MCKFTTFNIYLTPKTDYLEKYHIIVLFIELIYFFNYFFIVDLYYITSAMTKIVKDDILHSLKIFCILSENVIFHE